MLRQLGLEVELLQNTVSLGIEDAIVRLASRESLWDYRELLLRLFPDATAEVRDIVADIERITGYMDVLCGIDNPLFLDFTRDREYLLRSVFPRLFRHLFPFEESSNCIPRSAATCRSSPETPLSSI